VRAIQVRHIEIDRKIAPWKDVIALLQIMDCVRSIKPLIIHSITPKAGLLGMLGAKLLGIRFRFHTFTGQVWVTEIGIKKKFLWLIDKLIARSATHIFADSPSQCAFLKKEGIPQKGLISVMGIGSMAGVDMLRFHRGPTKLPTTQNHGVNKESKCIFLFMGRLVKDKGIFDLVRAFENVCDYDPAAVLWIVGPDEENLQEQLKAIVNKGKNNIFWYGPTLEPERYMALADVLVLPSYREGFGSVVIEAAACEVPTIAYKIDGLVDAVIDGETGLLVPLADVSALANAMSLLAKDITLRTDLGKKANLRVRLQYSSEAITAAWLNTYQSITG
jgi:glycosyltransferase involved in cell wall biosynthesis